VLDNSHTAFPPTAETIYAALLCIGGTRAPRFSSLLTLGMLLLAAGSLAMRCGLTGRQSWWVAALIATMPAIYFGSVNCFVDGIYAAFVLAAMRIGFDAEKTGHWAIFGIFCGLAMGTKYTGLLALPVLILTAAIIGISRKNLAWRLVVRDAFLAAAIACVVAAPYYARNWILLGCPIYPPPPGYEIFCSPKYLSAETIKQFHAYIAQRGAGLGRNFLAFVLLPYNLTYHTSNFHGAGGIGLCPLALGPLGMFVSRKDKFVKGIAIAAFLVVVAWFLTQQESRFLIHVYVIAAILSVIGWRDVLSTRNPSSRIIAGGIVATSLLYGMFMMDGNLSASVRAVVSPAFAQQERSTNIPYYQSFRYLNTTEDVKKVLILDRSVPPFYCDKEYLKPIGQWGEVTITGISTAVQAIDQVHALNITHILDVSSQAAPFQVAVNDPRLLRVFEDTNQRIYRVK
nr:hypothetical protein [Acidobacteriota bacterium]